MGLAERRHGLRENVAAAEFRERQHRRVFRQRASCHQLAPSLVEMLRELFDNLCFAGRREAQRRQPGAHFALPPCHDGPIHGRQP
jgi:hypothetical protein